MKDVSKSIARWASVQPQRPAVVDENVALSYGELDEHAGRWIGFLQSAGVAPGDEILLLLDNRAEFVAVLIAAVRADFVPIALNVHFTAEDIASLAARTRASILITTRTFANERDFEEKLSFRVYCLEELDLCDYPNCAGSATELGSDIVFFSSGTTGAPKGIVVPKSVFDMALPPADSGTAPQAHLLCRPLFFRAHLTAACNILQEGGTVVLSGQADFDAWINAMALRRVSFVSMGPIDLMGLLKFFERTGAKFPSSVNHLMITGAPLPDSLKATVTRRMPDLKVTDLYGTSETGAIAMIDNDEWAARGGSCGKPAFFLHAVVRGENGKELPAREVGEVWVKTRYRMREYYGDPAATSETIEDDYIGTGDLGFLDEQGYLHLSGRKRDLINRSGFHIFPEEVENVLRAARDVEDAVVVGLDHPERMQEPVAFIRLRDQGRKDGSSESAKIQELLAHCESRLARYKVPAAVWFVQDIPVNAAGKADRRRLAQRAVLPREGTFG
ncbi:class I adenylate-forming enzyme family protein [Cohnella faecalis]|nr:class I adenylate-forming enzyme family protein [Cohnella faecalis]